MHDRPPEQAPARQNEAGNLDPVRGYSIADAIRVAGTVGALGFGATRTISTDTSLITACAFEGSTNTFSLLILIHEVAKVLIEQCCRRDGRTVASTSHSPIEYSLYLSFRFLCIAISYTGMALIASDVAVGANSYKTTVGIALVTLSIFATRAISGSKHKATDVVLMSDEEQMEMGLRRARRRGEVIRLQGLPPESQQQRAQRVTSVNEHDVPLVSDVDVPVRAVLPMRPNQAFQSDVERVVEHERDQLIPLDQKDVTLAPTQPEGRAPRESAPMPQKHVEKGERKKRWVKYSKGHVPLKAPQVTVVTEQPDAANENPRPGK